MNEQKEQTTAIRAELQRLEDANGRLTATIVLEAARSPSSVLHSRFEWDDQQAAHSHRLEQARQLIRSVRVEIVTETKNVSTVSYVRDPEAGEEQGYVSTKQLTMEPINAAKLVDQEFARAMACLARAETLAEALGVTDVGDLKKPLAQYKEGWASRFLAAAPKVGEA